jgi:hypothetical protein
MYYIKRGELIDIIKELWESETRQVYVIVKEREDSFS